MVIWSAFRLGQYRVNDHPYHAPQFIDIANINVENQIDLYPC